jgi:Ca2+-binding RTX toxin-like protein
LKLGEGVNPANVELTRTGTIQNWFLGADYQLLQIEFGDGTVWSRTEINAMEHVIRATGDNGERITNVARNNRIYGGAGNDVIHGGSGDDIIYGGDGNDEIRGNGGNDILIGGKGDDLLVGGIGKNMYIWELGDGNDKINDYAGSKFANGWGGTLKLGEGVDPAKIELTRTGNNLTSCRKLNLLMEPSGPGQKSTRWEMEKK